MATCYRQGIWTLERFNKLHHSILGWLLFPGLIPVHQALDGKALGVMRVGKWGLFCVLESVVRHWPLLDPLTLEHWKEGSPWYILTFSWEINWTYVCQGSTVDRRKDRNHSLACVGHKHPLPRRSLWSGSHVQWTDTYRVGELRSGQGAACP